jgi:hypothetical protein
MSTGLRIAVVTGGSRGLGPEHRSFPGQARSSVFTLESNRSEAEKVRDAGAQALPLQRMSFRIVEQGLNQIMECQQ